MLFCSQAFVVFLAAVFALYWALPWRTARVWLLLGASFYFYASWSAGLALVVFASCLVDYLLARGMDATRRPAGRRALLAVSLAMNLGLLGYFKYANFFLDALREALQAAGAAASLPALEVLAPIGISFYTFEAISYTVDVYRRRIAAERSLAHFMLFITFFPHLMAGPIVRARDFLPQVRRAKRWDWARLHLGAQYLLVGAFKKMAIADRMPLWADPVFASPEQYSTGAVWLAVLAYAIQIYCDFSGYSDMALGAAHLLGYKLAKNFEQPYLSANVAEFWRRWHISLSSWLRDYLFIPLGGSRGGRWRTCRNLLVTMALGGLWHGAAWTFLAWGALHGLLLIGHRVFAEWCTRRAGVGRALRSPPGTVLRVAVTFGTVGVGWVLFRATSFGAAAEMLGRLFVPHAGLGSRQHDLALFLLIGVLLAGQLVVRWGHWRSWAPRLPGPVLGVGYAGLLTLALVLAPDGGRSFIYFQF